MMPMRARDVCRMGQSHKSPPEVVISVAVRQEVFALGSFHCGTTLWDLTNMEQESWREMVNLPQQFEFSLSVMLLLKLW